MKRYFIKTKSKEYIDGTIITDLPLEEIKKILVPETEIKELK